MATKKLKGKLFKALAEIKHYYKEAFYTIEV